jgi:hypothetical protein
MEDLLASSSRLKLFLTLRRAGIVAPNIVGCAEFGGRF